MRDKNHIMFIRILENDIVHLGKLLEIGLNSPHVISLRNCNLQFCTDIGTIIAINIKWPRSLAIITNERPTVSHVILLKLWCISSRNLTVQANTIVGIKL